MGYWAAAIAKPNCHAKAEFNLLGQGFGVYVPWCDAGDGRRVSLFGRYFFVWIEGRWRAILNTPGVGGLVMGTETPLAFRRGEVEKLQASENDGLVVVPSSERVAVKIKFEKDQQVKILSGPFAGLCGVHQGMSTKQREYVLLSLLGRETVVKVAAQDLVAA